MQKNERILEEHQCHSKMQTTLLTQLNQQIKLNKLNEEEHNDKVEQMHNQIVKLQVEIEKTEF